MIPFPLHPTSDPKGSSVGFCTQSQVIREGVLLHLPGSDSSLLGVVMTPLPWEIPQTGDASGKGEETPVEDVLILLASLSPLGEMEVTKRQSPLPLQ